MSTATDILKLAKAKMAEEFVGSRWFLTAPKEAQNVDPKIDIVGIAWSANLSTIFNMLLCIALAVAVPIAHAAESKCAMPSDKELNIMQKRELLALFCALEHTGNSKSAHSERVLAQADAMPTSDLAAKNERTREGLIHGAEGVMCAASAEIVWRNASRRFGRPPTCVKPGKTVQ